MINLASLRHAHEHVLALSQRAVDEELEQSGRVAREHVLDHSQFKSRTGALVKATKARVIRAAGGKKIIVSNSKKYAAAIDLGAKPHIIRPSKKKLLRFMVGGRFVFARSVRHPGNRAYRFLYRATLGAARTAAKNIESRLQQIAHDAR